jgi:aconitate hydratase
MGVLPLQFLPGQGPDELGLTGHETITVTGLTGPDIPPTLTVTADATTFEVRPRLDTPREADYYRHGGIMPYVLRHLLAD